MKILGVSISNGLIADSDGKTCSGSYLEFLLQPKPDTIRVLYNLNHDISNLLEMLNLSSDEITTLLNTTRLRTEKYSLRYVPSKLFSIKRPGAFSYFADAHHYVKFSDDDSQPDSLELACRARRVGEQVYEILTGLGIKATSLISPTRAYERTQIEWLYRKKTEANGNPVRSNIIDEIGTEVYGKAWESHITNGARQ